VTSTPTVSGDDIAAGVRALGLEGRPLEIHVSLRSFGWVDGGPGTLIDALVALNCTPLVATMATQAFAVPAPAHDRPARNGVDYAATDRSAAASPWPGCSRVYDSSCTDTDSWLGATAAHIAGRADRVRCGRPCGEFSAVGPMASALIEAETPDDSFGPLRALVDNDGWVVLMGVSLTKLTLLHLAEVEAGRRPFIRWALGPRHTAIRVMGGECSRGFDRLAEVLAPIERRTQVGISPWRAFPARGVVERAAAAIQRQPTITHCPDPRCIECADAIAGGPIEPD